MITDADISACGQYRYRLTRTWDAAKPPLTFVMLNPSTADATVDDPTIRRCIGFAKREGAGSLVVVNLYACRATDPRRLSCVKDPCGPRNGAVLADALADAAKTARPVVCAWGALGGMHGFNKRFVRQASAIGVSLIALGVTRKGHPRHPLYARSDEALVPFGSSDAGARWNGAAAGGRASA